MSWSISCFSSFLYIIVCFCVSNNALPELAASPSHCLVFYSNRSIPLRQVDGLAPLLKEYNTILLLPSTPFCPKPSFSLIKLRYQISINSVCHKFFYTAMVKKSLL